MGILNALKKFLSNEVEDINGINEVNNYVLPGKYMNFPAYPGKMMGKPIEKNTPKYDRLTVYYKGRPNRDYIYTIQDQGYIEATDVRYERDHTYIIVEEERRGVTKIAYHIKKY